MKISLLSFFIILFTNISIAQDNYISGRVIDKQTGSAISNANVFLAFTLIGTTSNSKGEFVLKNIPPAKYQIIVSHIQYEKITEDVLVHPRTGMQLEFEMEPKIYQLPEVVVQEDEDDWQDYYTIFKEEFLGMTINAEYCEILNPYNINFAPKEGFLFEAHCKEPIYVKNNYLGYRVTYFMNSFSTDGKSTKYSGVPYFQLLTAESDSIRLYWENNRAKTYHGSLREFICETSDRFINNSWARDELPFRVGLVDANIENPKSYISEIDLSQFMARGENEYTITYFFPGILTVEYRPEFEHLTNATGRSQFELANYSVTADIKGRNYDLFGFHVRGGYWVKQRLADTLPMEYKLPDD